MYLLLSVAMAMYLLLCGCVCDVVLLGQYLLVLLWLCICCYVDVCDVVLGSTGRESGVPGAR